MISITPILDYRVSRDIIRLIPRRPILIAALLAGTVQAEPVYLGAAVANLETKPQGVLAGQKKEFVLTLTSASADTPELRGDLSAIAGGMTAPIFSNQPFQIHRVGEARPGIQRFKFEVEIPAAERKQALSLRLKIRADAAEGWLPLPVVLLEAWPRTWKNILRNFTRQTPSGRLAGSNQLEQLFKQAEIETTETPAEAPVADQTIRVWFAEEAGDEFRLPEASQAIWVVFKKNVRGGFGLWRPTLQTPPCVVVDTKVLAELDSDPAAQEIFERALAAAQTLVIPVSDTVQSHP